MGMFVSRLLSSDVAQLEAMMSALASALRTGEVGALLADDGFWAIVHNVASNPATLSELRGYVSGLLEEDWRTSSLLLDMLSPGMSSTQRRFVVSLVKLECVSRALRSDILWALMLDRMWVTALWKFASGRQCSPEEEARLGINTADSARNNPTIVFRKTSGRNGKQQQAAGVEAARNAAAATAAAAPSQTQAAASDAAAAASASPSDASSLNPPPYVPPPRAARFFTILTLPTIRALLEDISRSPDAPPVMPPPLPPPPPPPPPPTPTVPAPASAATAAAAAAAKGKGSKPVENAPAAPASIPHALSAGIVAILAPVARVSDYKSNLILLLYRDLLKLEHIFERERAAILPPIGGDPIFTGLGMERSTYIVIRALIKFCLCGSGRKGHGHEHPGAANAATTRATQAETHLPPASSHPHQSHPHPSPQQHHGLSLVAQLLLDPDFQSTFLTHDFLSTTFQTKLQYFIDAWPEDVYRPPTAEPAEDPAAPGAAATAGTSARVHHPPAHAGPPTADEGLDAQLSLSLRSYADFFLQLVSDTHIQAFASFLRGYDQLFLEHLFATLYCDLLLPLMRPEQYIRMMLATPTAGTEGGAAAANGNGAPGNGAGGGNKKRRGGHQSKHHQPRFNPNNLLLFPPVLPADPSLPVLPPPAPIYVPLALLLSVGFVYHWLFEPVPISVLAQSKAQVDALRSKTKTNATQNHSQQQPPQPPKPHSAIERLRDLLLRMDVYAQWAQAAANPPELPAISPADPHVPRFSRSIRAVVTSAPSLLLLEFLQLHTPHIASCLSKTLDEINMLTTPPPSSISPVTMAAAMQATKQTPTFSAQPTTTQRPHAPQSAPPRDMFSPELSFHGGSGTLPPPRVTAAPVVLASTADPLLFGAVPPVLPVPSSPFPATSPAIRAVQQLHAQPPSPPAQKGWLATLAGWVWSSPAAAPQTPAPSATQPKAAASELPPSVLPPPVLLAAPHTLLPLLAPRRSRFDHYMQNQLRLWCNRVLEGRGFTQLFAAQQKAGGGPMGPQQVPSTIFVLQVHAYAHGSAATSSSGSGGSSNGGGIFPPLAPAAVPASSSAEAFYIELLAFDPQFVCELVALLYTYLWMDARDEHRIREKKRLKMVVPHAEPLPAAGPIKPACSALFPLVQRNMLRPESTPIDLGPIRPQEYLALICKQVGALWSDDAIAVFLGRSDNFWRMMLDTTWWEIISGSGDSGSGAEQQQAPSSSDESHPLLSHPRVPVVSATRRSTLHSLLSLISNKSSPYFSVLLELGHHSQFHDIFSEANVGSVLALLRLVCSWQVHAILSRFESLAMAREGASPTAMAHLLPQERGSSQDFYASLTAPFTFWGIVHSLSVVPQLRQQYLGALHWFLSKRNMDMQVEIWGVVKEVLYGETAPATNGEEATSAGVEADEKSQGIQVPAPAPLHLLSSPAAVASSPLLQQKLRLRRLRSLSQIAKSVHNSGILQAVFTFPLATAHFYSVWVAEMLWPTRCLSVDAYFPAASAATAEPVTTESVTSLLLSQLGSLLYTSARAASAQGFLQLPTIRSAFLEGIALALEEAHAFGSGAAQAAAKQAQLERAQARQIRQETKEAIRAQNEQRIREAAAAAQAAAEEANAAKTKGAKQVKNKKKTALNAPAPLIPAPPAPAAATQPSRKELRPAFNPEHSYRLPVNSSVPPTADIPSLTSRGLSLSAVPLAPAAAATTTTTTPAGDRAMVRAQSEVAKLVPGSAAPAAAVPSSAPTLSLSMLPDVIPARRKAEDDSSDLDAPPAASSAPAPSPPAASSAAPPVPASGVASTDEAVSLPPPFSFEPVTVVDEDDEERSGGGGRAAVGAVPKSDLSVAAAANAAAVAAALANPRGSLHADSALDLPDQSRRSASSSPAAAALPSIPSLPQKHRLLYSFFQLVLAQPIFKLVLTSPALWEMLSDIGFLELLTVLMFGAIEEGSGTTAAKRSGTATAAGTMEGSYAPRQSNGGAFQAARATLAHTREVLAAKRASLHAWQRLVAHWRFALFMDEMRSKHFETSLASAMAEILRFLNSEKGRALILAVMDGLEQREQQQHQAGAAAASTGKHGRNSGSSLSSRFHALSSLLSHRSTISLLTSPRFWALFADGTTLRYFSQGSYLKLWWYNSVRMRAGAGAGAGGAGAGTGATGTAADGAAGVVSLAQPVWRLVKEGGAKAATSVRAQTALRLEQGAQKLAGNHNAGSGGNGGVSSGGNGSGTNGGAMSGSKREQLKGFVRQKLSATASKLAEKAQPQQTAPAPQTGGEGSTEDASAASSPPPASLASLQQFFGLLSTVHSLLFARPRHETIRASL